MKVGFVGLGNVGGKLAGSLIRNGYDVTIRDLERDVAQPFLDMGASWAESSKALAETTDMVITCLPSPAACSAVMEDEDGIIAGLSEGKVWLEMSTTDDAELVRIAEKVQATGALAMETPVSGRLSPSRPPGTFPSSPVATGRPSTRSFPFSRHSGGVCCTPGPWDRPRCSR